MQPLHLNENVVILDTETTGIKVDIAEICEIAIAIHPQPPSKHNLNNLNKALKHPIFIQWDIAYIRVYDTIS